MARRRYNNGGNRFPVYVSIAERRAKAAKVIKKLEKQGIKLQPVQISGRTIAHSTWGKAWCKHLENFHDVYNRLERGRTYARNGSILDLSITPSSIRAKVNGSKLYEVKVHLQPLKNKEWENLIKSCSGEIGSMLELLSGKFSAEVMSHLSNPKTGLFPGHNEISFACSCLDGATMCKHVSAVLYGVGARLDKQPELLFTLRQVDPNELITAATTGSNFLAGDAVSDTEQILSQQKDSDLAELFGIELTKDTSFNTQLKADHKAKTQKKSINKKSMSSKTTKKNSRLITSKELILIGFSRYQISKLAQQKVITRQKHGIYATTATKAKLRSLLK